MKVVKCVKDGQKDKLNHYFRDHKGHTEWHINEYDEKYFFELMEKVNTIRLEKETHNKYWK